MNIHVSCLIEYSILLEDGSVRGNLTPKCLLAVFANPEMKMADQIAKAYIGTSKAY